MNQEEIAFWRKVKLASGIVIAILLFAILSPFTIVGASEKAVITRWGVINRTVDPGFNWVMPIAERVNKYTTRIKKEEVGSDAGTEDTQKVSATIALNYRINPLLVADLYVFSKNEDYIGAVISPVLQESIKAATAQYTATELLTKREEVKDLILENVKAGILARTGGKELFLIDGVAIVNFDFSPQFNAAIEAKVKAEQDALKAQNDLERIKYEADQKVATAEAEAKAIRLSSDAANNPRYVELKRLEVDMEYAKKWNGALPQQFVPGSAIPFINVGK